MAHGSLWVVYIFHDAVPDRPAGPGKAHSHYTW